MAEAMLSYTFATGDQLVASFDCEESFPDAAAECEAACKRMFAHAMGVLDSYDSEPDNAWTPQIPDTDQ